MRLAGLATAAITLVLVPAHAGAGTTRPPVALTATPASVALVGSSRAVLRVTNPGLAPVVVDVARAGFSLDLRGRPRVAPRGGPRAASSWLSVLPGRFVLAPGASRAITVVSRMPHRAEPGDHDALVLLTTRTRAGAGVLVRMRIGIVVVVRAPGVVVRRLVVRGVRVGRSREARILEVSIVNRGNVTEALARGRVRVVLRRGSRQTTLRAVPRDIRPGTVGIVQVPYAGPLRGPVSARVLIPGEPARPAVSRAFSIRL